MEIFPPSAYNTILRYVTLLRYPEIQYISVLYTHRVLHYLCGHCSMLRVFSALTLLFADDIDICAVGFGKEGNIGKISIG